MVATPSRSPPPHRAHRIVFSPLPATNDQSHQSFAKSISTSTNGSARTLSSSVQTAIRNHLPPSSLKTSSDLADGSMAQRWPTWYSAHVGWVRRVICAVTQRKPAISEARRMLLVLLGFATAQPNLQFHDSPCIMWVGLSSASRGAKPKVSFTHDFLTHPFEHLTRARPSPAARCRFVIPSLQPTLPGAHTDGSSNRANPLAKRPNHA